MAVWEEGSRLEDRLKRDPEITARLAPAEIEGLFDLRHHLKHVDTIFKRVFESA
jgi:adenylosuccinate lyase